MLDFIVFFVGLFLLIKGEFRFGARRISRSQGRLIGLVLMAPLFVAVCVSSALIATQLDPALLEEAAASNDLLAFVQRPEVAALTQQVAVIDLITLVIAVGAVVFIIMGIPPSDSMTDDAASTNAAPFERVPPSERPRAHPLERESPPQGASPASVVPPRAPERAPNRLRPAAAVPPPAAPPDIMTVEQAAAYTKLTPADIMALINDSKLGAVRSKGSYIIARSALDDYMGRG
ncbi:MAG: helix-turn-helix domain-containing protein [Chloroflexota bacterium]|nr:helix-turn-helix domain-containing protein [Chloroflexota bacterium]